jgi:T5orf172 domain
MFMSFLILNCGRGGAYEFKIYILIDVRTKAIKVGCSRDPYIRARGLSHQLGRKISLIFWRTIEIDPFRVEYAVHQKLRACLRQKRNRGRSSREWFEASPDLAICAINSVTGPQYSVNSRVK